MGNTSHPIIYLANKTNMITSLQSACIDSEGSLVLVVLRSLHTQIDLLNSIFLLVHPQQVLYSTAEYGRAYFQHGTLSTTRKPWRRGYATVLESHRRPSACSSRRGCGAMVNTDGAVKQAMRDAILNAAAKFPLLNGMK